MVKHLTHKKYTPRTNKDNFNKKRHGKF